MNPAPQTNPANPHPAPTETRDACGRFAKGNPGGPGNPYLRRVALLRQAMLNCVTEDDMIAITRAVIEEAAAGNMAAAKLIYQYVLGKPGPAPDLETAAPFAPKANGSNGKTVEGTAPGAPKANGSNGKVDEREALAAPKANGSNGGSLAPTGMAVPSGLGTKADQWLDRQVRRTMEALGKEPLANGL